MTSGPVIDVREFARMSRSIEGDFALANSERLEDLLADTASSFSYRLKGALGTDREPTVECIIRGCVSLRCQRCLEPFEYPIDISSTLVFVADESRLPPIEEEDPAVDFLVAEASLDVWALIEDEVILALPLAPKHEAGQCGSAAAFEPGDATSPFADLDQFKKR